jgi:hypothetical protein
VIRETVTHVPVTFHITQRSVGLDPLAHEAILLTVQTPSAQQVGPVYLVVNLGGQQRFSNKDNRARHTPDLHTYHTTKFIQQLFSTLRVGCHPPVHIKFGKLVLNKGMVILL